MKLPAPLILAALLALPLSAGASTAIAADAAHNHSHDHSHNHETHGALELNQGEKWETDAALRQGMDELHQIISTGLDNAHENALKADDYKKISGEIMTQVVYIIENCNLEPEPDAQFHILLGDIMKNVEIIDDKVDGKQPEDGLIKMTQTLDTYGEHFVHPDWESFDTAH